MERVAETAGDGIGLCVGRMKPGAQLVEGRTGGPGREEVGVFLRDVLHEAVDFGSKLAKVNGYVPVWRRLRRGREARWGASRGVLRRSVMWYLTTVSKSVRNGRP